MLSRDDTELLCRIGPGTPMGALMRQYWMPVLYSWELEADGAPQRVRLLGEDLVAFRDTNGTPGFVAENCPHRGASMFFGRNEEEGLRCVYHGWKFDTSGACVDMPNEPPESNFKHKVKIAAYKGAEFGGIIWCYMGPDQDAAPGVPQFEFGLVPDEQRRHTHKVIYECNWMQALEGELDTTHVFFLHGRLDPKDSAAVGLYAADRTARLHILDTDYGMMYGAKRAEPDGTTYWRSTQFLFPIYGMFPGGGEDGTVPLSIYVPIDDHNTLHMGVNWHPTKPFEKPGMMDTQPVKDNGELVTGLGPMKPRQTGKFHPDWWPEACPENDFLQNRQIQKTKSFTGIGSVRLQDSAVIWSMGRIMDRTREHLGTADAALIRVRRRLLAAVRELRDNGTLPPGVHNPERYTVRSCIAVLTAEQDWVTELADWHDCRVPENPHPIRPTSSAFRATRAQ